MLTDESGNIIKCNKCRSDNIIRSGMTTNGKQRYQCKDCHAYFVPKTYSNAKETVLKQKLTNLLYMAGVHNQEIQKLLGHSYPLIKKWLSPLQQALEGQKDLDHARRMDNVNVKIIESLKQIPDKQGKKWLVIELDDSQPLSKSILITNKNVP